MKLAEDGGFIMYKLKYNKIPTEWINGLPISNGRLAAMYWGDGKRDIISLNHERLWSAEYKGKEPDISYDKLPILRDLLEKKTILEQHFLPISFLAVSVEIAP